MSHRRRLLGPALSFLVTGGLLASTFVAFTWPMVLAPSSIYFRDGWSDIELFLWNLWWVKEAIFRPSNPLWTDLLYYPTGLSLAYHTLSLPQGLLALPFSSTGSYLLGYNALVFICYMATGLLVAWLGRLFTGSWAAGSFAGIYFVLSPPYMNHLAQGHLNLIPLQWLLGSTIATIKLTTARDNRERILLSLLLAGSTAAAVYTDLQHGLLLAMTLPVAYLTYRGLKPPDRPFLLCFGAAMVAALGLLLPLAIPVARQFATVALSSPQLVASKVSLEVHSVDLLGFFYPTPYTDSGLLIYHNLLKLPVIATTEPAFLGYATLPLLVLGVRRRGNLPLLAAAVLAIILAMGPEITVGDRILAPNPLFQIAWATPVLRISRAPERLLLVANLAFAFLAAAGLAHILRNSTLTWRIRQHPKVYAIIPVLPAIMVALEFLPTPHTVELEPLPSERLLQTMASGLPGAVLELPRNHGTIAILRMEYHQIAHGRPLITGYASRPQFPNLDGSERLEPQIALSTLRYLGNYEETLLWHEDRTGAASPKGVDVRQKVSSVLDWFGIRYVLVDKRVMKPDSVGQIRQRLNWVLQNAPATEDQNYILYKVDPSPEELVVDFGELWHAWEYNGQAPFRWSSGKSSLFVLSVRPQKVAVSFQAWSFGGARTLQVIAGSRVVATASIGEQPSPVTLELEVDRGLNQLVLQASGAPLPEGPRGRNLSFAITDPSVEPRN